MIALLLTNTLLLTKTTVVKPVPSASATQHLEYNDVWTTAVSLPHFTISTSLRAFFCETRVQMLFSNRTRSSHTLYKQTYSEKEHCH